MTIDATPALEGVVPAARTGGRNAAPLADLLRRQRPELPADLIDQWAPVLAAAGWTALERTGVKTWTAAAGVELTAGWGPGEGLCIAYRDEKGEPVTYGASRAVFSRVRLFPPDGDRKYLQPPRSGVHLYRPVTLEGSDVLELAREKGYLIVTEGELDAQWATFLGVPTVGLSGVDAWRAADKRRQAGPDGRPEVVKEGSRPIADLDALPWGELIVYIVYDSDSHTKGRVQAARLGLGRELAARGAQAYTADLPPSREKVGLGDWLLSLPDDTRAEQVAELRLKARRVRVASTTGRKDGDDQGEHGPAWEGRPSRSGGTAATIADVSTALHALQETVGTIYLETFSGRLLVEPGPLLQGGETRGFTDLDALQITRYLQGVHDMRRASKDKVLDAAQLVGYDNRRNALSDWLDSLEWDGVERLGAWLVSAYGVDDTEYTRCVGWNWLVSMVARAYRPGCKVDTMPVLEGEQGLGKSDSLRALVGALGAQSGTPREHRFVDTRFEPDNKDFLLTVRGRWLVEIAELHGLQKSDREAIKQFLSRQVDAVRVPYDRVVLDTPRTCVMVGTTNETEYLSDPTGARRFWPLSCKHVDLAWIEANRDQLWAEAVVRYKAGETWWYMPDDAQAEQEARSTTHPWAGPILRWLNEPDQKGRAKFEAHAILEGALNLTKDRQTPVTSKALSDVLRRHGWEHRRDRPGAVPRLHWWHRPQG